jgi:hypothetical protein
MRVFTESEISTAYRLVLEGATNTRISHVFTITKEEAADLVKTVKKKYCLKNSRKKRKSFSMGRKIKRPPAEYSNKGYLSLTTNN